MPHVEQYIQVELIWENNTRPLIADMKVCFLCPVQAGPHLATPWAMMMRAELTPASEILILSKKEEWCPSIA